MQVEEFSPVLTLAAERRTLKIVLALHIEPTTGKLN